MGLGEAERAKPLAAGRGPGRWLGAGCAVIPSLPPSPPCHPGAGGGTSQCPSAPQGRLLHPAPSAKPAAQLKLCLVNYSAAALAALAC